MKDRLKQLRKELGLSQEKFGEKIGVKTSSIGNWESGVRPIPNVRIFQICQIFKARQDWLENGLGEPFAQGDEPKVNDAEARLFERIARLTTEQKNALADFLDAFV